MAGRGKYPMETEMQSVGRRLSAVIPRRERSSRTRNPDSFAGVSGFRTAAASRLLPTCAS